MSAKGTVALLDDDDVGLQPRRPCGPNASLYTCMLYTFITVTAFLIVLPTSEQYIVNLGGSRRLAGVVVGATPFFSGLAQLPLTWVLRRVPLKRVLLCFCVVLIIAQVLYALAGVLKSPAILIVSRALSGLVSGPQCLTSYVAKAIPPAKRSAVMLRVGITIAGGYAAGVFLGGLLDLAPSTHPAGTASAALNGESLPGWLIAIVTAVELCLLLALFEEPPKPQLPPAPPGEPPPFPYRQLTVCFVVAFVIPLNIAAWEVLTALQTQNVWNWTPGQSAIFLTLALGTVVPMNLVNLSALFSDRSGMLTFLSAGLVGLALFQVSFSLPLVPVCAPCPAGTPCPTIPVCASGTMPAGKAGMDLRVGVYAVGMILFLNAMQIGRQFTWALIIKLSPMKSRPYVLGFNAMVYMIARGIGAMVTPLFPDAIDHCATFLGVTVLAWLVLAWACWTDLLPPPPQQQLPGPGGPPAGGGGPPGGLLLPLRPANGAGRPGEVELVQSPCASLRSGNPSTLPSVRFNEAVRPPKARVHILGTGAAFGHTYTTEQMLAAFKAQRVKAGDTDCDFAFAERVFAACQFEGHSSTLAAEDLFRTMSRSEYLDHRMTNLLALATRAGEEALKHWGGARSAITHLYWGTMTGGMHSPTIDIELVARLGLSNDVERTSIEGMGCLTGYRLVNLGRQTAAASSESRVLVIAGDLRSALGNSLPAKASRSDIVSVALFRDAASACVLSGGRVESDERAHYEIVCGKSRIVDNTHSLVDYREGDEGKIGLTIDKRLPDAIGRAEPAFVEAMLREAEERGYSPPDIEGFDVACHTGGPRVLHEVAAAIGASDEQLASSWSIMQAHGNLSGASNLAVLDHLNRATADDAPGGPAPHERRRWVLGLSMGPGACLEGLVLRRPTAKAPTDMATASRRMSVGSVKSSARSRAMSDAASQKWKENVPEAGNG